MKTKFSSFLVILVTAVGFFLLGIQWDRHLIRVSWNLAWPSVKIENRDLGKPGQVDFTLFWQVWQILGQQYLDKGALDPQKMVFGAISGMVRAVGDPYTAFLPPEQNAQIKEQLEGTFEGVGIQIGYQDDRLAVISPLKGTPADKAGIRAGDKILAIDGVDTSGISLPEAQAKIRGPKGSTVTLTIIHQDEETPKEVKVAREVILIKSLEWEQKDGVVVFHLRRFSEQTPEEWDKTVVEVLRQGQPKGVVLDLRDNPGGLLTGAVYVASDFVPSGVVTKQEKADSSIQNFRVVRSGRLLNLPLVVLINKGSASASEILAGALRQLVKAVLVGEKSFGKGTVQEVEELPENTSLHITVGRWLLPDGENIDNKGLVPDFEVKEATESGQPDRSLEKAFELLIK